MAQPAAYSIPGSHYRQDFDGLPATGSFSLNGKGPFFLSESPVNARSLEGWQIWQYGGSGKNAVFQAGTGSGTGQGAYSLGSAGATERALGSLASGSGIYAFGLILSNRTGKLLTNCTIQFTAEQWRKGGSGSLNTWQFSYQLGQISGINIGQVIKEPAGNFSSIQASIESGSQNGNLPANRQNYTILLKSINWQPGQELLLRWDDADDSGSDDLMALDDFMFIADNDPVPPIAEEMKLLKITDSSFLLQAPIHSNGNDTHLQLTYDTDTSFSNPQLINIIPSIFPAGNNTDTLVTEIRGLEPATPYAIRLIASSLAGSDTALAVWATAPSQVPSDTGPPKTKDTIPPKLISVQFPAEGTYASSDTLRYIFRFSEPVFIPDATPLSCKITIGSKTRYAAYQGGNGTNSLFFDYVIVPGDKDADAVKTATLIGATEPFDSAGNHASITGKQISSPNRILVDAIQPEISEVTVPEPGDYFTGDTLWFEVRFTKVLVKLPETNAVSLPLQIGKTTVYARLHHTD
ncbi:MAG TPA: hypothetical protein VG842_01485, partial [Sediminibacterium sp.]|nr:hypothetical protein [Sediminibacterium sp.]